MAAAGHVMLAANLVLDLNGLEHMLWSGVFVCFGSSCPVGRSGCAQCRISAKQKQVMCAGRPDVVVGMRCSKVQHCSLQQCFDPTPETFWLWR